MRHQLSPKHAESLNTSEERRGQTGLAPLTTPIRRLESPSTAVLMWAGRVHALLIDYREVKSRRLDLARTFPSQPPRGSLCRCSRLRPHEPKRNSPALLTLRREITSGKLTKVSLKYDRIARCNKPSN